MKNRRVLAVLLAVAVMLAMMPAMAFADTTAPAPETAPTAPAKSNDIVILGTRVTRSRVIPSVRCPKGNTLWTS